MIETIATKIIRCDNCTQLLPNDKYFVHVFGKDFCCNCSGKILESLEEEHVISSEKFKPEWEGGDGFTPYISYDLNNEPVIFMNTNTWDNKVYIYYQKNWINVSKQMELKGVVVDKNNIVHFIEQKRQSLHSDIPRLAYGKMSMKGEIILENERLPANFDGDLAFLPGSYDLGLYETGSSQKIYVLLQGEITCGFPYYIPTLYYSLKDKDEWSTPSEVKDIKKADFNMKFGRIYGITLSDTSSYIARVLFDDLLNYPKNKGISIGHSFEVSSNSAKNIAIKMTNKGYKWVCFTDVGETPCTMMEGSSIDNTNFQDKYFMSYDDHGSSFGWWKSLYYHEIPLIKSSFAIGQACSTNDFENGLKNTFGVHFLRQGGIGYIGSAGTTWTNSDQTIGYSDLATDYLLERPIKMGELCNKLSREFPSFEYYLLYGDPTMEVSLNE